MTNYSPVPGGVEVTLAVVYTQGNTSTYAGLNVSDVNGLYNATFKTAGGFAEDMALVQLALRQQFESQSLLFDSSIDNYVNDVLNGN